MGDPVDEIAAELGYDFTQSWDYSDECWVAYNSEDGRLAVTVAEPGGVQSFTILEESLKLNYGDGLLGVGSSLDDIAEAFPRDYGGPSGNYGPSGYELVNIYPTGLNNYDLDTANRAAVFEIDEAGIVKAYRVGAVGYVDQTHECYSPE